jgi:hypothetical protein
MVKKQLFDGEYTLCATLLLRCKYLSDKYGLYSSLYRSYSTFPIT